MKSKIKSEEDKYKDWLYETFGKIISEMLIDFVEFNFSFEHDEPKDVKGMKGVFSINYDHNYHRALIMVYPTAFEIYKINKNKLIDSMIHEACHMHTMPLVNVAEKRYISENEIIDNCENLTEVMSTYIRKLIKLTTNNIYS